MQRIIQIGSTSMLGRQLKIYNATTKRELTERHILTNTLNSLVERFGPNTKLLVSTEPIEGKGKMLSFPIVKFKDHHLESIGLKMGHKTVQFCKKDFKTVMGTLEGTIYAVKLKKEK